MGKLVASPWCSARSSLVEQAYFKKTIKAQEPRSKTIAMPKAARHPEANRFNGAKAFS
jgi:hypothetical protein